MIDRRQFHENYDSRVHIKGSSERMFGIIFSLLFSIIGMFPLWHGKKVRLWAIAAAVVLFIVAIILPGALRVLNRTWIQISLVISRVTNPLIMTFLYYFVITPMGVIMRVLGRDPLRLQKDKIAKSYWIEREPSGPAPETMFFPF